MKKHFLLLVLILVSGGSLLANKPTPSPCVGCQMTGTTPVNQANSYTYTLNAVCTAATSWSTTCGTITSSNSNSCTVYFNQCNCTSAVITAYNGSSTITSKTVTVNTPPALSPGSISNTSQTINYNTAPAQISASASSGGSCGSSGYVYEWFYSTNDVSFTAMPSANAQNYQPGALTVTTYYKRLTVCGCSSGYTTNTATVTVSPQINGGSISASSQTINYNTTPSGLTLSGVSGGNGTYSYQWQSSANSSFSSPANVGTNSTSYQPPALTATIYYRVAVTSGGTAYSASAVVNVYAQLTAGSISPSSQTINYNTTPTTMTLSGVSGGSGAYTYVWYSNGSGSYQPIGGATGTSYSPGAMTSTTSYYAAVSSNGVTVNTAIVTITVNPLVPLAPGAVTPASVSVVSGTSPGTLTSTNATGGLCGGAYAYQWQNSLDKVTWTAISGATALSYTPGAVSSGIFYRLLFTCASATAYSNAVQVSIQSATVDMNYIQTRDIRVPGTTNPVNAGQLSNPNDVAQTTQYFDGLGRHVQTVEKQASPLQFDQVSVQAYDAFGREANKYLPYTSGSIDGLYKTTAMTDQNTFNSLQFPGEQYYYGQTVFEPSQLNRDSIVYAPGSSWIGAGRGVVKQYLINALTDSVHIWNIDTVAGALPIDGGQYPVGQLAKDITTDEQAHQVVEYTDKTGHIVLKKVQSANTPGTAHVGWLCTYYVYDDINNVRFVITPRAVEIINTGAVWTIPQATANGLCYRYEYDYRNRPIIRKQPGTGEIWMVYDVRDRLVMTQDSNLRAGNQWLVAEYDGLDRKIEGGTIVYSSSRSALQQLVTSQTAINPANCLPSGVTLQPLTYTYYDDYSWVSGTGTSLTSNFASAVAGNGSYFITGYNASPTYASPVTAYSLARGEMTGNQNLVLGSAQNVYNVFFYDDWARLIQTQSINVTGGMDTLTTQYDFSGKTLRTLLGQAKTTNTLQTHRLLGSNDYDAGFRITSVWKSIDGAVNQMVDSVLYDELGQLHVKYLGADPSTGNPLDSLVYDYNLRGWTTGINKNYLTGAANHYFGLELGYDHAASVTGTSYLNPAYNGNIAGTIWKSMGDGVDRKYDFTYDNANRLMGAAYLDNKSGSGWNTSAMDYSVSGLGYDANGNITSMIQKGYKIGSSGNPIDSLTYIYTTGTNQLLQVFDGANDTASVLGDFHYKGTKQAYDYTYDGNGNLTKDNNKGIDTIYYDYLNLPSKIHMKGKGNIVYTYDASGNKLEKQTVDSAAGMTTTTLYLDGFQYQRRTPIATPTSGVDTLQFVAHEEGRARWALRKFLNGDSAYTWEYDFAEKDQLGDTRVLLTQEKDTAQYMATMEAKYRATERALFYNIDTTSYPRASVSGYPDDLSITNPNDSVADVNGSGHKVGPAIILKVMAGDKVDLGVQYYYNSMSNSNGPNLQPKDLLNSLASGLGTLSAAAHGSFATLSNPTSSPLLAALTSSIDSQDVAGTGKPQAYLNWVLLDNQFNYVGGNDQSGALQVGASGTQSNGQLQPRLAYTGLPITKSGYLYIYVSNATPAWDVYFDNLSVITYSGPMLEEQHYYPYGLTMAGISDEAIKSYYTENKYRFNKGSELQNKEFSDGSGLEMYETKLRELDPQLGRWWQIDSKPDYGQSPYSSMDDNPISKNDYMGDSTAPPPKKVFKKPTGHFVTIGNTGMKTDDPQYQQLVKRTLQRAAQDRKKAPPLIAGTLAITKGTYAAKAKAFGVGVELASTHNEHDLVGVRDNKNVNKGEKTYRNGMSGSLAGFGGSLTLESTTPAPDGVPAKYSTEQKLSAPGVSFVKKTGEDGSTYSGTETEVFAFKVGFVYGIDVSLSVNLPSPVGLPSPPSNGDPNVSDKTRVVIYVPDLPVPKTSTTSTKSP